MQELGKKRPHISVTKGPTGYYLVRLGNRPIETYKSKAQAVRAAKNLARSKRGVLRVRVSESALRNAPVISPTFSSSSDDDQPDVGQKPAGSPEVRMEPIPQTDEVAAFLAKEEKDLYRNEILLILAVFVSQTLLVYGAYSFISGLGLGLDEWWILGLSIAAYTILFILLGIIGRRPLRRIEGHIATNAWAVSVTESIWTEEMSESTDPPPVTAAGSL